MRCMALRMLCTLGSTAPKALVPIWNAGFTQALQRALLRDHRELQGQVGVDVWHLMHRMATCGRVSCLHCLALYQETCVTGFKPLSASPTHPEPHRLNRSGSGRCAAGGPQQPQAARSL